MTALVAPVNTGANFQAMLTRDRHDTRSNAERATETVAEMRRLVIADWAELDDDTELMVPDTSIAYAFARHGATWEPDYMRFDLDFIRGGTLTIGTTTFYPDGSITGTITPPAHRGELQYPSNSMGPHLHMEVPAPTPWWKRWTA